MSKFGNKIFTNEKSIYSIGNFWVVGFTFL